MQQKSTIYKMLRNSVDRKSKPSLEYDFIKFIQIVKDLSKLKSVVLL